MGTLRLGAVAAVLFAAVAAPAQAAFPGSNGRLAYMCVAEDQGRQAPSICTAEVDGTGSRLVTWNAQHASWSPDGRRLAYVAFHPAGEMGVVDANGANRTVLDSGGSPAWSADGSRVVYEYAGSIVSMAADGTDRRVLLRAASSEDGSISYRAPAWSPDGRWLAYVRSESAGCPSSEGQGATARSTIVCGRHSGPELWISSADGRGGKRLLAGVASFDWAPDSGAFAVEAQMGPVEILGFDGSRREVVPDGRRPRFSPDGTSIAFYRYENASGSTVYTVQRDGRNIQPRLSGWMFDWQRVLDEVPRPAVAGNQRIRPSRLAGRVSVSCRGRGCKLSLRGTLILPRVRPSAVAAQARCDGRVSLTGYVRSRRVARGRVAIGRDCRFSFKRRFVLPRGAARATRLSIRPKFAGGTTLLPRQGKPLHARLR